MESTAQETKRADVAEIAVPYFMETGFSKLEKEVIDTGRCASCGACIAFCPRIEVREGVKTLVEYDPVCGMCYNHCPRTFLPTLEIEEEVFGTTRDSLADKAPDGEHRLLGVYRETYTGRATKPEIQEVAQDGGVVTSLLAYALADGIIDSVVVTDMNKNWSPHPKVVTSAEELISAAGSKYSVSPNVMGVKIAIDSGKEEIAFIGMPCQIQALRKVQTSKQPYEIGQDKIKLLVGLFCMENFKHALLIEKFVKDELGIDPADVEKFDITKGELWIYPKDGEEQAIPVKELHDYANEGCSFCSDFTAELADISVGSVGSKEGWNTVLSRSQLGEQLLQGAIDSGWIEANPMENLEPVSKLADIKKKKARE